MTELLINTADTKQNFIKPFQEATIYQSGVTY